jgi:hypothetical protein
MKDKLLKLLNEAAPDTKWDDVATLVETEINAREQSLAESASKYKTELEDTKKLMEAKDIEHAEKMKTIVEKVDKSFTKKLQEAINTMKDKNDMELAKKVSDYLDATLEESIPEKVVVDYHKLRKLEKLFENMRTQLLVTDEFVQSEVREAVMEAKGMLEDKDKKINDLLVEKVSMKKMLGKNEAESLLESKVKNMPMKKVAYLNTFFKNADKAKIESKFNEACVAFDRQEKSERQKLVNESKNNGIKVVPPVQKVDDKQKVITESLDDIDQYVNVFENLQNPFRK